MPIRLMKRGDCPNACKCQATLNGAPPRTRLPSGKWSNSTSPKICRGSLLLMIFFHLKSGVRVIMGDALKNPRAVIAVHTSKPPCARYNATIVLCCKAWVLACSMTSKPALRTNTDGIALASTGKSLPLSPAKTVFAFFLSMQRHQVGK
jgi:hypothetical protein